MKKTSILKHLDFLLIDTFIFLISYISAYFIYFNNIKSLHDSSLYRALVLVSLLIAFGISYFIEPYKDILKRNYVKEIKELLEFCTISLLILSFCLFFTKTGTLLSRLFIALFYSIYFVLALIGRVLWKRYIFYKTKTQQPSIANKRILVITTKKELDKVIKIIKKNNYDLYIVDSICVIDEDMSKENIEGYEIKTNKDNVLSYLCHNWIDEVLIATNSEKVPQDIYNGLSQAGTTTSVITNYIEGFEDRKHSVSKMFGYTVIQSSIAYRTNQQIIIKRLMDICGGIVGCLITLILTIIIGPIIYIKSPGPIFYKQERIGLNGRKFYMYKFRSMIINADDLKKDLMDKNIMGDGMMFKVKDDPRIIPGIGNFIRKTSLDEFPQFINVLKGDMSLVGTRPPTTNEWVKYKLEHRIRMAIKPGITGMWQVSGRSKITDFDKVIEYDTKYINNWTLGLDIEILFKTVLVLFQKRKDEAM